MSKSDGSGEPTMEEILASIRKIIAEEPIGSRAAPQDRSAPALQGPKVAAPVSGGGAPVPRWPGLSEALGLDELLDGAVPTRGNGEAPVNGGGIRPADLGRSSGPPLKDQPKPPTPNAATGSNGADVRSAAARPAVSRGEPAQPASRTGGLNGSAHVPQPNGAGQAPTPAKPNAHTERTDADIALSAARAKIDRHLGGQTPDEPVRTPVPGLKSIRDLGLGGGEPANEVQGPQKPAKESEPAAQGQKSIAAGEPVQPAPKGGTGDGAGKDAEVARTDTDAAASADESALKKAPANGAGVDGGTKSAAAARPASVAPQGAAPASATGQGQNRTKGEAPRSLEDSIAEMLRPMLREWLDANLPRLVQQALREEMAKSPLPGKERAPG